MNLVSHVKSCGLYPRNNGKPVRGFEQDGDMIHGLSEGSLWKQRMDFRGQEWMCNISWAVFHLSKAKMMVK